MTDCLCDLRDGEAICPCKEHHPQAYADWLADNAPRLAVAEAEKDPICERHEMPTDAADVPELTRLRSLLSPAALEELDQEWHLNASYEPWPSAWEFALAARDNTEEIAAARERIAVRETLKAIIKADEYPLAEGEGDCYEVETFTKQELLREADVLAEVVRRAAALERMLRHHAEGKTTQASEYLT